MWTFLLILTCVIAGALIGFYLGMRHLIKGLIRLFGGTSS